MKIMDPTELGSEIRKMRKEKKLTLDELGKKTGFKKSYLSLIENGKQGIPQPKTLKRLATGLNEDYFDLMVLAGYFNKEDAEYRRNIVENTKKAQKELHQVLEKNRKDLEKDLYYLVTDYKNNTYYKQELLSDVDKEKVRIMLKTILE